MGPTATYSIHCIDAIDRRRQRASTWSLLHHTTGLWSSVEVPREQAVEREEWMQVRGIVWTMGFAGRANVDF